MSSAMSRLARAGFQQMRTALQQASQEGVNPAVCRLGAYARQFSSTGNQAPSGQAAGNFIRYTILGGVLVGGAYSYTLFTSGAPAPIVPPGLGGARPGDYGAVRKAIADVLDAPGYDDGSYGPVLVRLAWHASGTYDAKSRTGGSDGATMRFTPECEHAANAGLATARKLLEPIKAKFPWISYADLWTLAGCVAIEEMGGPQVTWRPGRVDKPDGTHCPPDGRLPDAKQGAAHIRDVFGRMGFSDQEMVALIGAHSLGRCHSDRSGFDGPWTNAPTTFSNLYFQELAGRTWRKRAWKGPEQYEDKESKKLMMLPADMALLWDRKFKKYVDLYAKDEDKFFADFASAWTKLMELGVKFPEGAKAV
uniref:Cytochrome c peroxidase, mitochondrial n=1 Tax=Chlamydomonas leiostraca TaxID=1034604 RepID=A0A7S0QWH3_9CHLO|mmetsp:Transcript_11396/g.27882  ORF Transcript_11396/g.27882 Transcript_11396/m.27882 type:complete len:364 (+) Transcript_11396:118-1209(+)|eukprot:CAMPEP_0202856952 /NCGR_PEP_ID=MMETSP1391-20130828/59_1 /ASSEMBLY_ACC=CAM_ASM_000867 /TAXON_ID=1034604 /ORGANISM="Chlamydomonas leiostraca, Strain SAG 11-49" /LENGTH=363 /DNA_ID=CAMNT_0049535679 /DNA_START=119 /DNA_END=1210 /DNA_ORIENTATION=-